MFGSRSMSHIAGQAKLHRMRHVVRTLVNMLPEEKRNTREVRELADYGCATTMHLLEINAERLDDENNSREYDFSPLALTEPRGGSDAANPPRAWASPRYCRRRDEAFAGDNARQPFRSEVFGGVMGNDLTA
jgi:NTE family protein